MPVSETYSGISSRDGVYKAESCPHVAIEVSAGDLLERSYARID